MTTPDPFLSPAETSSRLGVSVRALRLYERKGLVRPRRTEAGWRVYGPDEIGRLHQVLALKSLGIPLSRIADLISGREPDLQTMLAVQEDVLNRRKAELEQALSSVRAARDKLAADQPLSLDDLTNLAREAAMTEWLNDEDWEALVEPYYRKRLSSQQYDEMIGGKAEGLKALGLTEAGYDEAWRAVIAEATRLMERGDDSSPEAAAVLRQWMALTDVFTKGDAELRSGSLLALYDAAAIADRSQISEDLLTFMLLVGMKTSPEGAPAATPAAAAPSGPHPSEAVVRRVIAELRRGNEVPGFAAYDPTEGKGAPPGLFKTILGALGRLKSVRYLRTDPEGDVHRVEFANGRLICTIAEDEAGALNYLTLAGE